MRWPSHRINIVPLGESSLDSIHFSLEEMFLQINLLLGFFPLGQNRLAYSLGMLLVKMDSHGASSLDFPWLSSYNLAWVSNFSLFGHDIFLMT
jgi:hypothetical protein